MSAAWLLRAAVAAAAVVACSAVCFFNDDCKSCLKEKGCAWQVTDFLGQDKGSCTEATGAACQWTDQCPPNDGTNCAKISGCADCASALGCGWCDTSGTCRHAGPQKTCNSGCYTVSCLRGDKAQCAPCQYSNCRDCTNDAKCGWDSGLSACVPLDNTHQQACKSQGTISIGDCTGQCGTRSDCGACSQDAAGCSWCASTATCRTREKATTAQCTRVYSAAGDCPGCERRARENCLQDARCGVINAVADGVQLSPFTGYDLSGVYCVEGDASAPFPGWPARYPSSIDLPRRLPPSGDWWLFGSDGADQLKRSCPHFVAPQSRAVDVGVCASHGTCPPGDVAASCVCDARTDLPKASWWGPACEALVLRPTPDQAEQVRLQCGYFTSIKDGSSWHPPTSDLFTSVRRYVCCDDTNTQSATDAGCVCKPGYQLAFSEASSNILLGCHATCNVDALCNRHGTACGFLFLNASVPICTVCDGDWQLTSTSLACSSNYKIDVKQCQSEDGAKGPCAWNESSHQCSCHAGVDKSAGFPTDSCSLIKTAGDCSCDCGWCNGFCIRGDVGQCYDFAAQVGPPGTMSFVHHCTNITGGGWGGFVAALLVYIAIVAAAVGGVWYLKGQQGLTWMEAWESVPMWLRVAALVVLVVLALCAFLGGVGWLLLVVALLGIGVGLFWFFRVRNTGRTWAEASEVARQDTGRVVRAARARITGVPEEPQWPLAANAGSTGQAA